MTTAPVRACFLDSIRGWGGGEAWCVATATALVERGHRIVIGCAAGSELEERARATGIETWSSGRPGSVLVGWALGRYLRREGIEAVVANVGRDVRTATVACGLSGAALLQRRGIARALKRGPLERWIYGSRVRRVVANCEAIRCALLDGADFVDPSRFVVIPNAVRVPDEDADPGARFRARAALGLDEDAPVVGVVGRLAPMKGLEDLVDAWPLVRRELPGALLVLAGDGELAGALRERARERGVGDAVRLLGFQRDVGGVLSALDVFALPSVRDEGASNALLEAMAHGLPAVVTDCGGLPELVVDGQTGAVVGVGDVDALAGALTRILARDGRAARAEMGRKARERARERYSVDVVTEQWETLLREVSEQRG
jgi:glycosyltransferase involved in cell wall biosynthesis